MSIREIGCCGAYCGTCRAYLADNVCRGCKLGYESGARDINKSRCVIKRCCFKDKKFETCAECPDYACCAIIQGFYRKNGYKYQKYRQAIEFIREKGYEAFLSIADGWKGPYGKLD
ncbi:MAG: DUF3795 domain-containing protein [Dehalococcoidales bacterium]|nr:DUF3795 domain-containing protein [Dehalococcoidales bacterium]